MFYKLHCTVYVQIFKGCKFHVLVVNWLSMKFSPSKVYWQLEWQRLTTLARDDGMLYLSSCSRQGSLKKWPPSSSPNSTFQSILYGPNSGLWYILVIHQTREEGKSPNVDFLILFLIEVDNEWQCHMCRTFVKECSRNPWISEGLVILENIIAKMLNLWHSWNLHTSKICTYMVRLCCLPCLCYIVWLAIAKYLI